MKIGITAKVTTSVIALLVAGFVGYQVIMRQRDLKEVSSVSDRQEASEQSPQASAKTIRSIGAPSPKQQSASAPKQQMKDSELSDEELKATLDWLNGLSKGEGETQQAESQEDASPYEIETNAQEDWEGKVRAAYMESRKAYIAIRDQLVPIQNERFGNGQRIEEIIIYEMKKPDKDAAALREEFNYLRGRNDEISAIVKRNMDSFGQRLITSLSRKTSL